MCHAMTLPSLTEPAICHMQNMCANIQNIAARCVICTGVEASSEVTERFIDIYIFTTSKFMAEWMRTYLNMNNEHSFLSVCHSLPDIQSDCVLFMVL